MKASTRIKAFLTTLGLFAALSGLGVVQSPAAMASGADTFTFTERIPFDRVIDVPCAGESVHLTGELQDVLHFTESTNGGWHLVVVDSAAGMSAVGLTSGNIYRGVGTTRFSGNVYPGHIISGTDNSLLIGPGPGNNIYFRSRFHATFTPDGTVILRRELEEVTCQ